MMFYHSLPIKTISNVSARPSIINIGAILSFNSTIGRVAKVAIEAAVDDINSNPKVLSGTKLNVSMLDTKSSPGFQKIVDFKCLSNTHHILFLLYTFSLKNTFFFLRS